MLDCGVASNTETNRQQPHCRKQLRLCQKHRKVNDKWLGARPVELRVIHD